MIKSERREPFKLDAKMEYAKRLVVFHLEKLVVLEMTARVNNRAYFKWVLFSLLFVLGISSCDTANSDLSNGTKIISKAEISIDTVEIVPQKASQIGFFQLKDGMIFYVDQAYGIVEEFSITGKSNGIKKRELDGPEELQGISELIPTQEGYIIRHEWIFYQYDSNWEFVGKSVLQFPARESYDEMMDNPKGEYIGMYEIQNYNAKTVPLSDGYLITKIDVEHPIFNAFITRDYYRESRILAKVNPFSGVVQEILGTRPDSYESYQFVPFHNKFDFHISADNHYYITHEIDSMIYVFDSNWELKESFGASGIDMKTNYLESQNLDVAFDSKQFYFSRKNEGYYKDIYIDEENNLVLRTYRQGSDRQDLLDETYNPLQLQVFKDNKLLGDFSVPGRFKVLGKAGDYYVVDGYFDEQNEKQGFYLMTIN